VSGRRAASYARSAADPSSNDQHLHGVVPSGVCRSRV
jgi:hypothetical protein